MGDTVDFVKGLLKIHDETTLDPKPSFVRITTITFLTKVNANVDIEKIKEAFSKGLTIRKAGSKTGFKWSLKDNGFYNQATIEYRDGYSKKSVKIFPNSTVHVTGCYSLDDCKFVIKQLCFIFSKILEIPIVECDELRIVMINTNFSVNSHLDLSKIIAVMKSRGCIVTFNPETYSAVKIKFVPGPGMKQITASIFSSGKIIITGAVNLREILATYDFILKAIQSQSDSRLRNTETIDVFETFMGFSLISEWRNNI